MLGQTDYAAPLRSLLAAGFPPEHISTEAARHIENLLLLSPSADRDRAVADHQKLIKELNP